MMKVGIDMYCYHRYFGEVYPEQGPAPKKMTVEDFIDRAKELEVDCALPGLAPRACVC